MRPLRFRPEPVENLGGAAAGKGRARPPRPRKEVGDELTEDWLAFAARMDVSGIGEIVEASRYASKTLDMEDEITKETMLTQDGKTVHPRFQL